RHPILIRPLCMPHCRRLLAGEAEMIRVHVIALAESAFLFVCLHHSSPTFIPRIPETTTASAMAVMIAKSFAAFIAHP
ncbi:MAG TPA: hypothetical protein PK620_14495, partial [Denitromonas sp.]|nr:hypothetical protein [Denitromonas sp.]HQV16124.1 hypothetical protein [Denitromonas sp.]